VSTTIADFSDCTRLSDERIVKSREILTGLSLGRRSGEVILEGALRIGGRSMMCAPSMDDATGWSTIASVAGAIALSTGEVAACVYWWGVKGGGEVRQRMT
jgi:hypothetical protein